MLGSCLEAERDFSLRFEYRGLFGSEGDSNHGFLLNGAKVSDLVGHQLDQMSRQSGRTRFKIYREEQVDKAISETISSASYAT